MKNNSKKAQGVVEYMLILILVAISAYFFVTKIDLQSIKNYVFVRPSNPANPSQIRIEPMTDDK